MKVLIDTNVALNKLLNQAKFFEGSNNIFKLAEIGQIVGFISASAVTDIYYISRKNLGKEISKDALNKMLQVFQPATVTGENIFKALDLDWGDFEDAVQYIVGESLAIDYIITRNTSDFSNGTIPSVTPEQFLEIITSTENSESSDK